METTERIVEAYVRYVRGWATIPNIKCAGQFEIDLLAIEPVNLDRYHVESGVSVSGAYSRLTAKPFSRKALKERVKQAGQRRTIGYFIERKFGEPKVVETLKGYDFLPDNYSKVIVSWGWDKAAALEAKKAGIILWDFRSLMNEIAAQFKGSRVYFTDDTLRTLNLYVHAVTAGPLPDHKNEPQTGVVDMARNRNSGYWVYENFVHDKAVVHQATCSFCNGGRGIHGQTSEENSRWRGSFKSREAALSDARRTGRTNVHECAVCSGEK